MQQIQIVNQSCLKLNISRLNLSNLQTDRSQTKLSLRIKKSDRNDSKPADRPLKDRVIESKLPIKIRVHGKEETKAERVKKIKIKPRTRRNSQTEDGLVYKPIPPKATTRNSFLAKVEGEHLN